MLLLEQNRKSKITIKKVDSIPCSLEEQALTFDCSGNLIEGNLKTPWPMEWVQEEMSKYTKAETHVSGNKMVNFINPEEVDQLAQSEVYNYIDTNLFKLLIEGEDKVNEDFIVNSDGLIRYTKKDFIKKTKNIAKGLIDIGVKEKERVAIYSRNSIEYVALQFALSGIGAIMVPLNAYEKGESLKNLLEWAEIETIIIESQTGSQDNLEALKTILQDPLDNEFGALENQEFPYLKRVICFEETKDGLLNINKIEEIGTKLNEDKLIERNNNVKYDDIAQILFTSGTEAKAKGVILTYENIIENAIAQGNRMWATNKDVVLVQAPMFHCFGCIASVLMGVIFNCKLVMMSVFQGKNILAGIEREKCTLALGVPTMFFGILDEFRKNPKQLTLRGGIVAGASISTQLMIDLVNELNMKDLISAYGLTEGSPCITSTSPDSSLKEKAATVGKPIPGVQIKIVNTETREEQASGEPGEICIKGYNITKGYYKQPEVTASCFDQDGWLCSGDVGYIDQDGNLVISSRIKDIIIRSGENISPREVEEGISNIIELEQVHVVGVHDDTRGEELFAFIIPKKGTEITAEKIKEMCKGKIATQKIPRYINICESVPTSATGKVTKKSLVTLANKILEEI